RYDRAAGRDRLGIPADRPLVLFLGTPRPHKGLEPLAEAVASLTDLGAMLAIVGAPPGDAWCRSLAAAHPQTVRLYPPQPWSLLGPTLAAADAVALPQARLPFTEAQVPAKVYDAMAMARPIVASAVGDLPEILDQGAAGLLVPPGDTLALAAALRRLLTDRELAAGLGAAARRRAVERYSYAAMERVLEGVFARLLPLGHES
ncbi:MAG TPA: glycosyltransferase, partial [Anaerolineae bacterium]|nr:glycosyltransferase [Anaerolineae bacterium]